MKRPFNVGQIVQGNGSSYVKGTFKIEKIKWCQYNGEDWVWRVDARRLVKTTGKWSGNIGSFNADAFNLK